MALDQGTAALVVALIGAAAVGWQAWQSRRQADRAGDHSAEGTFREQLMAANRESKSEMAELRSEIAALKAELEAEKLLREAIEKSMRHLSAQLQWAIAWGQTVDRAENDPRPIPAWLGLQQ